MSGTIFLIIETNVENQTFYYMSKQGYHYEHNSLLIQQNVNKKPLIATSSAHILKHNNTANVLSIYVAKLYNE